ncbi:MAG: carboxypeptidase-like regulatory domain-containing protein [Flavobacteriaceae bacterium]|nr:carboxypeptidase-like regulatory domain-containing protein [Flavobacteriaceae bacterium]
MNPLYSILLLFLTLNISAQKRQVILHGIISNDSIPLENINVFNKTTQKGTVTNQNGVFKIIVKLNDTLSFSNMQHKTKWVIIKNKHLLTKSLEIKLLPKTNNLPEVVVQNMAIKLGLPNASKKPLNKLERNLNYYSQEPVPIVILAMLIGQSGGIDDLYNIISGNRKKDRKLKSMLDKDQKDEINQNYILEIRDHFKDVFFINTLKIEQENINAFINYCIPENIIFLFNKKRYLDMVDVFLSESKSFKNR